MLRFYLPKIKWYYDGRIRLNFKEKQRCSFAFLTFAVIKTIITIV